MKNLIFSFMMVLVGLILCQPETTYGQNNQKSVKSNPPKLVKFVKPTKTGAKNKRKKTKLRRKVDMSKVPRVIKLVK